MLVEVFRNIMKTKPKLGSPVLFTLGHGTAEHIVAENHRLKRKGSSQFLRL